MDVIERVKDNYIRSNEKHPDLKEADLHRTLKTKKTGRDSNLNKSTSFHNLSTVKSIGDFAKQTNGISKLPTMKNETHKMNRSAIENDSEARPCESPTSRLIKMKNAKLNHQLETKDQLIDNPDKQIYTIEPENGYVVDPAIGKSIQQDLMAKIKADIEK